MKEHLSLKCSQVLQPSPSKLTVKQNMNPLASVLNWVLARYWQSLVGMNLISSEPQALRLSKAVWG
jgi:hypothetical protein